MNIPFYKYQGTGNDFVMIDNRNSFFPKQNNGELVRRLCDRRFGVGGDGLILLENHSGVDFRMVYYNADGNEGSMCGNGGRCIVAFDKKMDLVEQSATFHAIDGKHIAEIRGREVALRMSDVDALEQYGSDWVVDTGSPHYVRFVENVRKVDVFQSGRAIRYSDDFKEAGINVNFVGQCEGGIFVRTYERGVEDETLSCGTGVTAAALAYGRSSPNENEVDVTSLGGGLSVRFRRAEDGGFNDIWLCGSAEFVFEGVVEV